MHWEKGSSDIPIRKRVLWTSRSDLIWIEGRLSLMLGAIIDATHRSISRRMNMTPRFNSFRKVSGFFNSLMMDDRIKAILLDFVNSKIRVIELVS